MKLTEFLTNCGTAEPVNNAADYTRVSKWVKKATTSYVIFTILAVIISIFAIPAALNSPTEVEGSGGLVVLMPIIILLTMWGFATMGLYFREVFSSVYKSGKSGYQQGSQIQTTHVDVTAYGNGYQVSSYTENKGCLFAIIGGAFKFVIWAVFCVYIGPFLTFKKIHGSKANLAAFKR